MWQSKNVIGRKIDDFCSVSKEKNELRARRDDDYKYYEDFFFGH